MGGTGDGTFHLAPGEARVRQLAGRVGGGGGGIWDWEDMALRVLLVVERF